LSPSCGTWSGCIRTRPHDYKRHGTTTLFAALEVATRKITADEILDKIKRK
jgi:hypothetical protein